MILELLKKASSKLSSDKNISQKNLLSFLEIDAEKIITITQEALTKFIDNDKFKELTPLALNEAERNELDPASYKKALRFLSHSQFLLDKAAAEYNKGVVSIESLLADRSITQLANLYHKYKEDLTISELLNLNSQKSPALYNTASSVQIQNNEEVTTSSAQIQNNEEVTSSNAEKTTFLHALFYLEATRENIEAIKFFFKQLSDLAKDNPKLVNSYLNLSDDLGKTALRALDKKSSNNEEYKKLKEHIYSIKALFPEPNLIFTQNDVDTHTTSIHSSVDRSIVKLAKDYMPNKMVIVNDRDVTVFRDSEWSDSININIKKLKAKLEQITQTKETITDFIQPKSNDIEKEVSEFKFKANTALNLIKGLETGSYKGGKFFVNTNETLTCGLTLKEIVAIGFSSLEKKELWSNAEQENTHFINLIENMYIAKRGYNIDFLGENEWETKENNQEDLNKCTGGTVNQLVMGLQDNKLVEIKIINRNTMKPPVKANLPLILENLYTKTENKKLITKWIYTGILQKELSTQVINELKKNQELSNEFSQKEIDSFGSSVLNSLNTQELKTLKPSSLSAGIKGAHYKELINDFIYDQSKGYILYIEYLYLTKEIKEFNNILMPLLEAGFIENPISKKPLTLFNSMLNSQDKQFVEAISIQLVEYLQNNFDETIAQKIKNQHLFLAIESNSHSLFCKLLEMGADINAKDNRIGHSNPVLIEAIEYSRTKTFKFIAEKFPDIVSKFTSLYNETALHIAAKKGHLAIVKFIAEKFPDLIYKINKYNSYNKKMALDTAAEYGQLDIVKFMVKKFPDIIHISNKLNKGTILDLVVNVNHLNIVKFLVIEFPDIIYHPDSDGNTILHRLVDKGIYDDKHFQALEFILNQYPASSSVINFQGETILHIAAKNFNHKHAQNLILEKFPNMIYEVDFNGNTALHIAAKGANVSGLKSLLSKIPLKPSNSKKDIIISTNKDGDTVLHMLAKSFQTKESAVDNLLKKIDTLYELNKKAGINPYKITNNAGDTAFITAIKHSHFEVMKVISDKYPDSISDVDIEGNTPLTCAISEKDFYGIRLLLDKFPDIINTAGNDGKTALHIAAEKGNLDILKCILEKSSDMIAIPDAQGNTVLHIIAKSQDMGMLKLITPSLEKFYKIINLANKEGQTASEILIQAKLISQARELDHILYNQANAIDEYGDSELHRVVTEGSLEPKEFEDFIKSFIENRGDINLKNKLGKTAFDIAQENYNQGLDYDLHIIETIKKHSQETICGKRNIEPEVIDLTDNNLSKKAKTDSVEIFDLDAMEIETELGAGSFNKYEEIDTSIELDATFISHFVQPSTNSYSISPLQKVIKMILPVEFNIKSSVTTSQKITNLEEPRAITSFTKENHQNSEYNDDASSKLYSPSSITSAFKAVDIAVDVARLVDVPTLSNAQKVILDASYIYSISVGLTGYSLLVNGASIIADIYKGNSLNAFSKAIVSAGFMLLPAISNTENLPYIAEIYQVAAIGITGYSAITNAYSFYLEQQQENHELKSFEAYRNLFSYLKASPLQHIYNFSALEEDNSQEGQLFETSTPDLNYCIENIYSDNFYICLVGENNLEL